MFRDNEINNSFSDSYDNDDFSNNADKFSDKSNVELNLLQIKPENSDDFELTSKEHQLLYFAQNSEDMEQEPEQEVKKEEKTEYTHTTKTKAKTEIKKLQKISGAIFDIMKINKKLGRIKKNIKINIKGKHNKNSQDNIIQKIKARFLELMFNYINDQYAKFLINNNIGKKYNKVKFIKRISPAESKKIKKEDNLKWFSLKLKDLFSMDLSSKYSNFESDYNRKQIELLYKKNEAKNVIDILNKSVSEMYEKYCQSDKCSGFETLENDLIALRRKMEENDEDSIDEYMKKYKEIAENLELIFRQKKSRNSKNSKKII